MSSIYDTTQIYEIGDFNYHTMVPQKSVEERRLEKILRKFAHHVPLFSISPCPVLGQHELAIRMHVRMKNTSPWDSKDNCKEIRAFIPYRVFSSANDEDISRWVHNTIVRVRQGKNVQPFDLLTVHKGRLKRRFKRVHTFVTKHSTNIYTGTSNTLSRLTRGLIVLKKG